MNETHDIFISYSHKDIDRVRELVKILKSKGWSIWFDERIRSGEEFDQEIENALSGAKCVIVVWSQNGSKSAWVRAEAEEALDAQKLLPICIDPNTKIPLRFRQIQTAMVFDLNKESEALKRFLADVQYMIKSASVFIEAPDKSQPSNLMIVPGKWRVETKVLLGLSKAKYQMDLKPNGDVFGKGKMGIFGGEFSGNWRFDDTETRLYLDVTSSMGNEMWSLKLLEATENGFKAIDNYGRQSSIQRIG